MPAAILMGHIRTEILFQRNISELRSTFCCRVWNYMFFLHITVKATPKVVYLDSTSLKLTQKLANVIGIGVT